MIFSHWKVFLLFSFSLIYLQGLIKALHFPKLSKNKRCKNSTKKTRQILSRNQKINKNSGADWSVRNLRGKTIRTTKQFCPFVTTLDFYSTFVREEKNREKMFEGYARFARSRITVGRLSNQGFSRLCRTSLPCAPVSDQHSSPVVGKILFFQVATLTHGRRVQECVEK